MFVSEGIIVDELLLNFEFVLDFVLNNFLITVCSIITNDDYVRRQQATGNNPTITSKKNFFSGVVFYNDSTRRGKEIC